eukprot:8735481-Alexandrium_andersonii.AAC.1
MEVYGFENDLEANNPCVLSSMQGDAADMQARLRGRALLERIEADLQAARQQAETAGRGKAEEARRAHAHRSDGDALEVVREGLREELRLAQERASERMHVSLDAFSGRFTVANHSTAL